MWPCHKTYSAHTHLAVLWRVEDVHSAGFDTVGLCPSVQSKAALSAPAVAAWQRAIVPGERQTKNKHSTKIRTWEQAYHAELILTRLSAPHQFLQLQKGSQMVQLTHLQERTDDFEHQQFYHFKKNKSNTSISNTWTSMQRINPTWSRPLSLCLRLMFTVVEAYSAV